MKYGLGRHVRGADMTGQQLLLALTLGTAVLALWSYVRWPKAAPDTMKGAIWRVLLALALFQVGGALLELGLEAVPSVAVLVIAGAVIPVLTYGFLASIWFLKVCADQMRGAA
jgi:hypothetical protein